MTKNPFLNALGATGYIFFIASIISFLSRTQQKKPDTLLAPILFLSMLTLSVTVMGFLFFYQPTQLFLDGKKKLAVNLFLQTVAVFAGITIIILTLLLSGIIG